MYLHIPKSELCCSLLLDSVSAIPVTPNYFPFFQMESHRLPGFPDMCQSCGVNTDFDTNIEDLKCPPKTTNTMRLPKVSSK